MEAGLFGPVGLTVAAPMVWLLGVSAEVETAAILSLQTEGPIVHLAIHQDQQWMIWVPFKLKLKYSNAIAP